MIKGQADFLKGKKHRNRLDRKESRNRRVILVLGSLIVCSKSIEPKVVLYDRPSGQDLVKVPLMVTIISCDLVNHLPSSNSDVI